MKKAEIQKEIIFWYDCPYCGIDVGLPEEEQEVYTLEEWECPHCGEKAELEP